MHGHEKVAKRGDICLQSVFVLDLPVFLWMSFIELTAFKVKRENFAKYVKFNYNLYLVLP